MSLPRGKKTVIMLPLPRNVPKKIKPYPHHFSCIFAPRTIKSRGRLQLLQSTRRTAHPFLTPTCKAEPSRTVVNCSWKPPQCLSIWTLVPLYSSFLTCYPLSSSSSFALADSLDLQRNSSLCVLISPQVSDDEMCSDSFKLHDVDDIMYRVDTAMTYFSLFFNLILLPLPFNILSYMQH